jgi:hypothetical protein
MRMLQDSECIAVGCEWRIRLESKPTHEGGLTYIYGYCTKTKLHTHVFHNGLHERVHLADSTKGKRHLKINVKIVAPSSPTSRTMRTSAK